MQVLDTAIHAGTGHVTVEFLGEDGENIAVTMVVSDRLPGDAALVDRAKELMVQCAAFGGRSAQGSQDGTVDAVRPADERPIDVGQDLYTFEYREGGSLRRLDGVELPNAEAVHDEALRSAIDLLDDPAAEPRREGWAVRGGDGDVILSIAIDEAKRERRPRRCDGGKSVKDRTINLFMPLHAIAAARGDGLRSQFLRLFEARAALSDLDVIQLSRGEDAGLDQAGPNPIGSRAAVCGRNIVRFPGRRSTSSRVPGGGKRV
ncbi:MULTISPECIES: hypothetical protein [unclassified Mesorhizobium]|uniref:DUF6894 family protein n=1 Tax=unclassified Mesorhizobium TaxID=325217 RepID=UPI0015E3B350|nr:MULTISPECIES: hypothetical protein [unclassified Mesorhizobium]